MVEAEAREWGEVAIASLSEGARAAVGTIYRYLPWTDAWTVIGHLHESTTRIFLQTPKHDSSYQSAAVLGPSVPCQADWAKPTLR